MLTLKSSTIVLFFVFVLFESLNIIVLSDVIHYYGNKPYNFISLTNNHNLNRRKRQISDELNLNDDLPMNATFPPDTEIQSDETVRFLLLFYNFFCSKIIILD